MQRNARFLLCKSLSGNKPFRGSPKPTTAFASGPKPSTADSTYGTPHPFYPPNPGNYSDRIRELHPYPTSIRSNPPILSSWKCAGCRRGLCGGGDPADHNKEVDEINLKFAEAREEIDAALESKETVYFDEEAQCARDAVKVVLDMFEGLLARLPEKDRAALQRSMGLKILQLKAELEQLND